MFEFYMKVFIYTVEYFFQICKIRLFVNLEKHFWVVTNFWLVSEIALPIMVTMWENIVL